MIGVEIFSGVGGMSLGAKLAGIDVKLAIEIDPEAALTFQHNHKKTRILITDIGLVPTIDVDIKEKPTILMGGPPCQGFSYSNQKNRDKTNDKNWLFLEFVRLTREWMPDWIVFENVSGITQTERGFFLERILFEFISLGYTLSYKILNAADYGVPQKRQRFFLVGSRHGIQYKFPKPSEGNYLSVKDAIDDLPILSNGANEHSLPYRTPPKSEYAKMMRGNSRFALNNFVTRNNSLILDRYKHVPQGGNWENIPPELMRNYADFSRCHTGIYHRLDENQPSTVIGNYRKNMLIHPLQDRGLSVREAARLQSFPDWFEFKGCIGSQQQQVGNAVPPMLAKAVFDQLLKY